MSTKKQIKLKQVIALTINLQFLFSTNLSFAAETKANKTWNTVKDVTNIVGQLGSSAMQGLQQLQSQQMAEQQKASLKQGFGLKLVDSNQLPSVLVQNGCMVVEARTNLPTDACDPNKFDPAKAQSGYYAGLLAVAEDNSNDLQNLLTSGHERMTTQGVGCYAKALNNFTATLNSRVTALEAFQKELEQAVVDFQKVNEQDIENLKRGNALLEGKPEEYLKDVKFEDNFKDTQCASILGSETFKSTGKSTGFRGIKELLDKQASSTKGGAYTPSQILTKTVQMKDEIRKIAKKVGEIARSKNTLQIDPKTLGIRTNSIQSSNPALQSIIAEVSSNAISEQQDLIKEVTKVAGANGADIIKGIQEDSIDIDTALFNYERSSKNTCFNDYLKSNFGSVTGITAKIQDPNVSAKANKEADSAFKNTVTSILTNDNYTIEQKISLIKTEEQRKGNSRYTMTTGKSMDIQGKSVGASIRMRTSDMISIFTDNCVQKFNSQATESGKSQKQIVSALRSFKNKKDQLQKTFASKIEQDIINQMENCPSDTNTGKGQLSCDNALNPTSTNFCLRTASVCASSTLACQDKANKVVETTRSEQKVIAKRYKTNMDNFKLALVSKFKQNNLIMEQTARQLDGMYQMGSTYSTPLGLDLSLLTNKLMKTEGIDPSLKIEDPEAYLKTMVENVEKLKNSVAQANSDILNGTSEQNGKQSNQGAGLASQYSGFKGEIQKYEDNLSRELEKWNDIKNQCFNRISDYNQIENDRYAQETEAENERYAKVSGVCNKLGAFEENPAGWCDEAGDLGDEVLEIAAASGDRKAASMIKAFGRSCAEVGAQSNNTHDRSGSNNAKTSSLATIQSVCASAADSSDTGKACDKLKTKAGGDLNNLCNSSSTAAVTYNNKDHDKLLKNQMGNYCYKNAEKSLVGKKEKPEDSCQAGMEITAPSPALFNAVVDADVDAKEALYSVNNPGYCSKQYNINSKENTALQLEFNKVQEQVYAQNSQKISSDLGSIQVSACNSTFEGGTGKDFLKGLGEQIDRGLAGANGSRF